ncbi:ABC1 family-domain-containing protein [Mycotypha africana]|uniref:ABC1 family-domain-containing protein n=1 Tax=Mycotypha africana TaxID=64632 RepID=UPI0023012522|nr:ABC1 family-domain-containing protein [Mycotypha africana]KAI8987496.1 ABC1 family-domain-containing protein [Mycotypha africana]
MSFFLKRLVYSKAAKFALGTTITCTSAYAYDSNTEAQVLSRNVRTLYNGIALAVDYKFNFKPQKSEEAGLQIEQLHERTANRVFDTFERNGGLYIKVGQVIGTQAAILPIAYQKRARRLFDSAPAVPFESVERIFKEDFDGKHPSEVFAEFDETPVASASIAQVHKARLKNGDVVAVKIQKPAIQKQMNWDLRAFRLLLNVYERIFDLPLTWSCNYIEEHLRMETDFEIEANNAKKAWKHIQEEPSLKDKLYVPKVYDEYTSKRVLVCEWVDAVQLTDKDTLQKSNLDPVEAMKIAVEAFASQIFRSGFVHGDPHPGNVLVRKGPNKKNPVQVVLLDHGLYIQESEKFRKEYCLLWEALFMLDLEKIADICKEWGITDPNMFASITLQRPFTGKKALHTGVKIDIQDMYEMQLHMKERIKTFLKDQALFPRELIFISRNMNIVRANNKAMNSPVNRINIMARWAVRGISRGEGSLSSWRSFVFECTLFFMSLSFWLVRLKDATNRYLFGSKARGLEDILDETMKEKMYEQFGVRIDPSAFDA